MAATAPQPVLVYARIVQNRLKTALIVMACILLLVPLIGGVTYGVYEFAANNLDSHHRLLRMLEEKKGQMESLQHRFEDLSPEARNQMGEMWTENEERIGKERAAIEKDEQRPGFSKYSIMGGIAFTLVVPLVLLLWNISSDPVSKVLAMSGAQPAGNADEEAKRLLENLAIGAGLPPPKLYVIHSLAPNAFAAGLDPAHSVVVVTRGLLMLLDRRELEGVLAHELSHIGNGDTRLNTAVIAITLFLQLPYLMWRRNLRRGFNQPGASRFRIRWTTAALLPIYIYVLFIAPLFAALLRSAISRGREFLADADAVLLTRFPEGLLSALAKIAGAGTAVAESNPLSSHLYFANPLRSGGGFSRFRDKLLATHPPIEARITRLMEFGARVPGATIEQAVKAGVTFAREHPPEELSCAPGSGNRDALSAIQALGDRPGRVCRIIGTTEAVPMRERDDEISIVRAELKPGTLIVVLETPSRMRQVLTATDMFGYIPRKVKLQPIDMLPAEISDPAARAAIESQPLPKVEPSKSGLTPAQIALAVLFGFVAFAGIVVALIKFGG